MRHLNIRISGRVQGVSFRYSALKEAERLGIKGFIRNEFDASVYIEAEGEESVLEEFLNWCRKGPPFAHVNTIRCEESPLKHFTEFKIM